MVSQISLAWQEALRGSQDVGSEDKAAERIYGEDRHVG